MTTTRVLLLEDNEADADLIRKYLKESPEPLDVVLVERLSAAMERLAKEKFDAMISDLHLPDSQGLDTFLAVHARFPELPIVVLTGLNDQGVALRALRQGAQDYIVKGAADATRVLGSLRYAVERQRMLNEVIAGLSKRERIEAALRKCATAHLWEAMFSTLGEGASAILYNAGNNAGRTTYEFLQGTYSPANDEEFARAFTEHFGLVKLFLVEEMRFDREANRLDVRVRRNFEVEIPRRTRDKPSCHFLRGLLGGTASHVLGVPDMVAREKECEQVGAEACAFEVTQRF